MYFKYRTELTNPIVKAKLTGYITYPEILRALSQKEAIVAIAKDLIVMHKQNALLLEKAEKRMSESSVPPIAPDAIAALRSSSGPVTDLEILDDLIVEVFGSRENYRLDKNGRPQYLPEYFSEVITADYKTQLIKDLNIPSLNKIADGIEKNLARKIALLQSMEKMEKEAEKPKKDELESSRTTTVSIKI